MSHTRSHPVLEIPVLGTEPVLPGFSLVGPHTNAHATAWRTNLKAGSAVEVEKSEVFQLPKNRPRTGDNEAPTLLDGFEPLFKSCLEYQSSDNHYVIISC